MSNTQPFILQDKPSAAEIPVYWTLMGLLLAIAFFFVSTLMGPITLLRNFFLFFAVASIVLAAFRILIDLVEREMSLYTLTEDCLTVRRGLTQRINTIPIEHVQQVLVTKPILGQFLNYGTIHVRSPGRVLAIITRVPNPDIWQSKIMDLRHVH